jgi:membrane-bound serine protease (ClpP class)
MALIVQSLANPTLAYALFVVGCCALLTELFHPGGLIPGITGGLCLILAFAGFLLLPVSWGSLALIVAALALFTLDVHFTAHGGFTALGLVAFAAGSLTLYGMPGSHAPQAIPLPLIAALMLGGAGLSTFVIRAALHTRHMPSVNGPQRLLGRTGVVTTALTPTGTVRVAGELWSAQLFPAAAPRRAFADPRRAGGASHYPQALPAEPKHLPPPPRPDL